MSIAAVAHVQAAAPGLRGDRYHALFALADCSPGVGEYAVVDVRALLGSARVSHEAFVEAVHWLGGQGFVELCDGDGWESDLEAAVEYVITGERVALPKAKRAKAPREFSTAAVGFVRWFADQAETAGCRNVSATVTDASGAAAEKLLRDVDRATLRAVARFALADERFWGGKVLSLSKLDEKWDAIRRDWQRAGSPEAG